jgi:hypothetical protein
VIKAFLYFVVAVVFVIIATTVKFGKRTLWGHAKAIWSTEEAKDARDGIEEKAGPAAKEVKERVDKAIDDVDAEDDVEKVPAPKW